MLDYEGVWAERAAIDTDRRGCIATRLSGDRVLVVGGHNGSNGLFSAIRYDPIVDAWSQRAALNVRMVCGGAVTLNDGRALVIGGTNTYPDFDEHGNPIDERTTRDTVYSYNDSLNAWTQVSSMLESRAYFGVAITSDERVVVTGGAKRDTSGDSWTNLRSVELYRAAYNLWSQLTPMPAARRNHGSVSFSDNRVLVATGTDGNNRVTSVWLLDIDQNIWTTKAIIPETRVASVVERIPNDRVIVIGGDSDEGDPFTTYRYDYVSNSWSERPSSHDCPHLTESAIWDAGHTTFSDGRVFIVGGYVPGYTTDYDEDYTRTWIYDDRDASEVDPVPTMNVIRAWSAAHGNWPVSALASQTPTKNTVDTIMALSMAR